MKNVVSGDIHRPRRFCPRFSLRTLIIAVTLVCAYFATWETTKRYGVGTVSDNVELDGANWFYEGEIHATQSGKIKQTDVAAANSPFPFLVLQDEIDVDDTGVTLHRRFYLWLLGPKFKLPFESTW